MTSYVLIRIDHPAELPDDRPLFDLVPHAAATGAELVVQGPAKAVFEKAATLCTAAELNHARMHQLPRELRGRVAKEREAEMDEYRRGEAARRN